MPLQVSSSKNQPHIVTIKEISRNRTNVPLEVSLYLNDSFATELVYNWAALIDGVGLASINKLGRFSEATGLNKYIDKAGKFLGYEGSISETLSKLGMKKEYTEMGAGFPDHLKFSLPCRLWTNNNADTDVYQPLRTLDEIATPPAVAIFGPTSSYEYRYVSVLVGNFFYLAEAVILGVQKNYSRQMVRSNVAQDNNNQVVGKPMVVDVNISISSKTVADWEVIQQTHINISTSQRNVTG